MVLEALWWNEWIGEMLGWWGRGGLAEVKLYAAAAMGLTAAIGGWFWLAKEDLMDSLRASKEQSAA